MMMIMMMNDSNIFAFFFSLIKPYLKVITRVHGKGGALSAVSSIKTH